MRNLINDWRIATLLEKARFIIVIALMLAVGIVGIINAIQFAHYFAIDKSTSWHYLMATLFWLAMLGLLSLIKLSPKNRIDK